MMKIIAVDDEEIALEILSDAVREAEPSAEVAAFDSGEAALAYAEENKCAAAFLDIEMSGISGIALARELKLNDPEINIVFATGYSEYALEAIEMHVSGYITKPITAEKVKRELEELRFPVKKFGGGLRIQCFGNFDVFSGDKPLEFKYSKAKEMLAYLVDRNGAMCSNNEIISVLWEDEDPVGKQTYFKSVRRDLLSVLKSIGCGGVIIQRRGEIGIDKEKVVCDYFDWLDGKPEGINAYRGEYMQQYSWSELTHGMLQ